MKHAISLLFLLPFLAQAQDTTPPVISDFFKQDTVYLQVLYSFGDLLPDYKVVDAIDGDVTELAYFDKKVDSTERLPQKITFIAPDKSGNKATIDIVVQTVDTIAPILSLKGDSVIYSMVNGNHIQPGIDILENYKYQL